MAPRPNTIVISVDDLVAWAAPGAAFSDLVHAPNIQRLADTGVNFTNAYTPEAICNPARTATFTGLDTSTTGVHANDQIWTHHVAPAQTFPAQFVDAGYAVGGYGKLTHEFRLGPDIHSQMFTDYQGVTGYANEASFPLGVLPAGLSEQDMADTQTVDAAIAFLQAQDDTQPYLLNVGLFKPHLNWVVPQEYFDLYPIESIVVPGLVGDDLSNVPAFIREQLDTNRGHPTPNDAEAAKVFFQSYLASLSYADAQIGRLLDYLDQTDTYTETNIVLWSDHGYHLGDRDGVWGKFTLWEEAAKVPLIFKLAENANAGTTVDDVVNLLDIYPTLMEMNDLAGPGNLEGDSLVPLLTGVGPANGDGTSLTWMYGSAMLRTPDYAFILYEDGSEELYDMVADPDQLVNLALDPGFDATRDALRAEIEAKSGLTPGPIGTQDGDSFHLNTDGQTATGLGGDDRYYVIAENTTIVEAAGGGDDFVYTTVDYTLPDHVEHLVVNYYEGRGVSQVFGNALANAMTGAPGSELLRGFGGNDSIRGSGGSDTIEGGDGNDLLSGGNDTDILRGGAGQDTIRGNGGDDTVEGDAGNDLLFAAQGTSFVRGGTGADILIAGAGVSYLDGGAEADDLRAGTGRTFADYTSAAASVIVNLSAPGQNTGDAAGDRYTGIAHLHGSAFDDTLTGTGADNILIGGAGADQLIGGLGADTASYATAQMQVRVDLAFANLNTNDAQGDTFSGISHLEGSGLNDDMRGDASANRLTGGAGHDIIYGRDGDDTLLGDDGDDILLGDAGADRLEGGSGIDRAAYWTSSSPILADLQFASFNLGAAEGDTFVSIENLQGTSGADDLRGDAGANWLIGGGGNDTLYGRLGDDTLDGGDDDDLLVGGIGADLLRGGQGVDRAAYWTSQTGLRVDLQFSAVNTGDAAGDEFEQIENVQGSRFDDDLRGDGGDNLVIGGDGRDILHGRLGADTLQGGEGNDTLVGNAGADILEGGAGRDRAAYWNTPTGVLADLQFSQFNTADAQGDIYLSIEDLQGSAWNDQLRGDASANILHGGGGRDEMYGRLGNDTLEGAIGDDFLVGGVGADVLNGGEGFDIASYWTASAAVTADLAAPGSNTGEAAGDTFIGIEGLQGSGFDDAIRGDGQDNRLIGGAGADTLAGGAGSDTLEGGTGADTFIFAAGSDTIRDFNGLEQDVIHLQGAALGIAGSSVAFVFQTYATDFGDTFIFDFSGGVTLRVELVHDTTNLQDYVSIV